MTLKEDKNKKKENKNENKKPHKPDPPEKPEIDKDTFSESKLDSEISEELEELNSQFSEDLNTNLSDEIIDEEVPSEYQTTEEVEQFDGHITEEYIRETRMRKVVDAVIDQEVQSTNQRIKQSFMRFNFVLNGIKGASSLAGLGLSSLFLSTGLANGVSVTLGQGAIVMAASVGVVSSVGGMISDVAKNLGGKLLINSQRDHHKDIVQNALSGFEDTEETIQNTNNTQDHSQNQDSANVSEKETVSDYELEEQSWEIHKPDFIPEQLMSKDFWLLK